MPPEVWSLWFWGITCSYRAAALHWLVLALSTNAQGLVSPSVLYFMPGYVVPCVCVCSDAQPLTNQPDVCHTAVPHHRQRNERAVWACRGNLEAVTAAEVKPLDSQPSRFPRKAASMSAKPHRTQLLLAGGGHTAFVRNKLIPDAGRQQSNAMSPWHKAEETVNMSSLRKITL